MEQEKLVEGFRLPVDEKGEYDVEVYSAMAEVCNKNQELTIVDHRPEYFSLEKIPEPTVEEKSNQVKSIRNQYMSEVLNKTERYEKQKAIGLDTTESEDTYRNYLLYLQYLRDVPQSVNFPNDEVLTFDKWKETNSSDIVL
ncbi:hypothetical protein, partial [Actinobacillus minor]|uniref:hypothetical protein n=1 Tax=Actinobacillus minor TaxID=51047 RepID=UPI0023F20C0E